MNATGMIIGARLVSTDHYWQHMMAQAETHLVPGMMSGVVSLPTKIGSRARVRACARYGVLVVGEEMKGSRTLLRKVLHPLQGEPFRSPRHFVGRKETS
jgi:hypothetical protein